MPRSYHRFAVIALWWAATAAGSTTTAPTTGPGQVDNPTYKSWAKFTAGSTATLAGDMDVAPALHRDKPDLYHYTFKFTLVAMTIDHATIRLGATTVHEGQTSENPDVQTADEPSRTDTCNDAKITGTADVTAMGQTFKCSVVEGNGGFGPCSGGPCKMYVCRDVPGGLVKFVGEGPGGNPMTLLLTGYTVK